MSARPRPDRNAEDEVAQLCRALGASVQKVGEDDNGWDLLVEFPPQVESAFPDVDPALTRCLIQVKSNQSRRTSTRVTLSNALKFAKDSLPCFVVLATYPSSPRRPEALYLRHIWAQDMAQAMKASRETSARRQPLNRKHLPIVFTTAERVDDGLAEVLLAAIAREGIDYAGKKTTLAASLGYEEGWGEGRLVLADGHDEEDLQDLMLGLRPDLPIHSFTATEVRFGIAGAQTTAGPGRLSLNLKPTARCALTLQRRDTGETLTWTGGLFTSGMNWLAAEQQRLRIAAGPMEVVISGGGEVKGTWSAPLLAPKPLDDLEKDAVFRSWMNGAPLDLEVWTERGVLPSATMVFNPDPDEEAQWGDVVEAIQALSRVVPVERRPDDLTLSMEQLLDGLSRFSHFAALLKDRPTTIRVLNEAGLQPGLELATHIVFPWVMRLGEYFLVSVVEREITAFVREGAAHNFTTVHARLLRGTAMKASDATDALVAGEVRWAKDRASNSDKTIVSFQPEGDGLWTVILSTPD